ncbi:type II toxin-antitoxin system VapC family toxin [Deltaproteobacteria bacterium TL4]
MNLFFDTSALIKIFHKEQHSDQVIGITRQTGNYIWVSELARIEFVSAVHRRFRMREITESDLHELLNRFNQEWPRFYVEPLGEGVLKEAESLLLEYGQSIGLKALDALHLATFNLISQRDWIFVVADTVLTKIAQKLGISIFEPLIRKD